MTNGEHYIVKERTSSPLRTLGYLAVIGLLAIVLAGPILGLLSVVLAVVCVALALGLAVFAVLLPFAVIGFIVWVPIRLFLHGDRSAWEDIRGRAKNVGWALVRLITGTLFLALGWAGWTWARGAQLRQDVWCKTRRGAFFVSAILVETASGAVIGALLGWVANFPSLDSFMAIYIGAGIGAMIGFLLGVSRRQPIADEVRQ